MSSAEKSFIGFAKQALKGTMITNDAAFDYVLFNEGTGVSPNNVSLPLDDEVGGGALMRNVVKVGVFSGGRLSLIPRPATLGHFLLGALGKVVTTAGVDAAAGSYSHVFTLGTDQFDAPYYTVRSAPGNLWGETAKDCRFNGLSMNWRGANFVRADVGFVGGTPEPAATTTWGALAKVDGGPQFLSPLAKIEVPDGTVLKVLQGAFTAGMAIPLDEQWIIGSYSPDAMDIVKRMFSLSMVVKLDSETLYKKIMYDPAGGSAWAAELFREADLDIVFNSDQEIEGTTIPFSFSINGNTKSGQDANIVWSAQPISLRAGKTITMALTGTFLADPVGDAEPITVTLVNDRVSY